MVNHSIITKSMRSRIFTALTTIQSFGKLCLGRFEVSQTSTS